MRGEYISGRRRGWFRALAWLSARDMGGDGDLRPCLFPFTSSLRASSTRSIATIGQLLTTMDGASPRSLPLAPPPAGPASLAEAPRGRPWLLKRPAEADEVSCDDQEGGRCAAGLSGLPAYLGCELGGWGVDQSDAGLAAPSARCHCRRCCPPPAGDSQALPAQPTQKLPREAALAGQVCGGSHARRHRVPQPQQPRSAVSAGLCARCSTAQVGAHAASAEMPPLRPPSCRCAA